ncbi:AraC family transcriptional regulator [Pseudomaricurvus alkylphenolicus]|uniref:AraC family transcriptional regulator n=1 Tax=Pseudomaricurvus alkylphenolicus TaxID=1306991 RepID=UPI00141FA5E7|nr:AraC family transcriptional regulator [Pseudomaricurvus alkylphenolicus]NIB40483.1 AraC family transcriptional regulator [Pseudomaricurvus alkylphenolicus]
MSDHGFWRSLQLPYLELRYARGSHNVYGLHAHREYSIGLVASGEATSVINGTEYQLGPGDLVLINPEEPHSCNPNAGTSWGYYMLYIAADWWQKIANGLAAVPGAANFHLPVVRDASLASSFTEFAAGVLQHNGGAALPTEFIELELLDCLLKLVETTHTLNQSPSDLDKPNQPLIDKIKTYLHSHVGDNVQLQELCEIAHRSPGNVIRLFKQHTGMSPYAYLQNYRINQAKVLLREGQSISQVAQSMGFSDQSHLNRIFKRHVASTPRRYQKPATG